MFEHLKFEDLESIAELDRTHENSTVVTLVRHNQEVLVCKAISKNYLNDAKKQEHFQNQLECLQYFASKKSTHINRLLGHFEDSEHHYLLLEAEEGLPLHKLMQMAGKFHDVFCSLLVTEVCWILQELHDEGWVYRDIKASNFILEASGKLKLIDMGLAKRIGKKRTSTVCGTIHSIPPEVLLGSSKEGYSYEFDYYGLGILIYQLTVGLPPFGYHTNNPNIMEGNPKDISDIKKGLTEKELERLHDPVTRSIVEKLLQPRSSRLGLQGGIGQILQHKYFTRQNISEVEKIYQGAGQALLEKYKFGEHKEEIVDFGIEKDRYGPICPDDPFHKFG